MSNKFVKENEKLDKELEKIIAERDAAEKELEDAIAKSNEEFNKNVIEPVKKYCDDLKVMYDKYDKKFEDLTGIKDED